MGSEPDLALEQRLEAALDLELVVLEHGEVQPPPRPGVRFGGQALRFRVYILRRKGGDLEFRV